VTKRGEKLVDLDHRRPGPGDRAARGIEPQRRQRRSPYRVDRVAIPDNGPPAVRLTHLDHLILPVNDVDPSVGFFTEILGFTSEGESSPFTVIRVTPDLTLQLAPWGTRGGQHLAFSMSVAEFDSTFERVREAGIPYGDSFHDVGNMRGPGREDGARGPGAAVYVFDPSQHLIEIRHYGD
jgi:catechol 2,3-dioxygenase-like lactoylglutathione lyase family enzyme